MAGESLTGAWVQSSEEPVNGDYVEQVLSAVEQIPPGYVASYGDIAEFIGRGGPRQVGAVLARHGGAVAWWRVVRSDGRPARHSEEQVLALLGAESVPRTGGRIDMRRARFHFDGVFSQVEVGWGSQAT